MSSTSRVDPATDSANAWGLEGVSGAAAPQALARLEVAGEMVPSVDWFIYAFVRKEAVVSSQIEGTPATLVDLFEYKAERDDRHPVEDVRDICNYLDALKYARGQLGSPKGLPLSMRMFHEAHRRLMRGVRGADKQPGQVRRSQNWIGGTRPGNARTRWSSRCGTAGSGFPGRSASASSSPS